MSSSIFSKAILRLVFVFLVLSEQCFGQWTRIQDIDSTFPVVLVSNTRCGIFVSTAQQYQQRVFRSIDLGRTWQPTYWADTLKTPFPSYQGVALSTIIATTKNVFALDWKTRLLLNSIDSGKTWSVLVQSQQPILTDDIIAIDSVLVRLYGGSIFLSTDNGMTWRYNVELGRLSNAKQIHIVENTLTISSSFGEVYQTKDLGKTWKKHPANAGEKGALLFANYEILWRQEHREAADKRGYYTQSFSGDSGKTWLPFKLFDSTNVIYQAKLRDRTILLSTSDGLYSTSNLGQEWRKESGRNGLPLGSTGTFEIIGNEIFVAVVSNVGQGLYRTDLTTVSAREEPQNTLSISSPAPNPSTDYTDLAFTLPRAAQAGVTLYSTLGTEVWRSESASMSAGEQHIRIDTRHLPTGVYAYRLMMDGVSSVGRVVVVR